LLLPLSGSQKQRLVMLIKENKLIKEKDIIDAYLFLRKENHSIPSEAIEFMRDTSLKELRASEIVIHRSPSEMEAAGYVDIEQAKNKMRTLLNKVET